jgi:hypothetical protein
MRIEPFFMLTPLSIRPPSRCCFARIRLSSDDLSPVCNTETENRLWECRQAAYRLKEAKELSKLSAARSKWCGKKSPPSAV